MSFPPLKFTARLDNSPDMDFDLLVYEDSMQPTCDAEPVVADDEPALVQGNWPDSLNNNDSRWLVFEVKHAGGNKCGAAASALCAWYGFTRRV